MGPSTQKNPNLETTWGFLGKYRADVAEIWACIRRNGGGVGFDGDFFVAEAMNGGLAGMIWMNELVWRVWAVFLGFMAVTAIHAPAQVVRHSGRATGASTDYRRSSINTDHEWVTQWR